MPSLCFLPAYKQYASKQISWEEYLHHCLSHYVDGFVDHENEWTVNKQELHETDPFTYALWTFQVRSNSTQDVSTIEAVFHAYASGSVDTFKHKLSQLEHTTADTMRTCIALLALRERKMGMIRYIMNSGMERYDQITSPFLERMMNEVNKTQEPELFEILQQCSWRETQAERARQRLLEADPRCGAPAGAEKWFDFW